MRNLPAPAVWLVATTGNVIAAAFNSQIDADPMAISAWQLVVALVVTFAGALTFEGSLHLWPAPARAAPAGLYPPTLIRGFCGLSCP